MKEELYMKEIEADNCAGLCCEEHCSKPYTHYADFNFHGICVLIGLCDEHSKIATANAIEEVKNENRL